jgi:hypothetical protein
LRKLQTSPKLAELPDQILLTLVGINLLQTYYADKKACWTMVVNKAFYIISKYFID